MADTQTIIQGRDADNHPEALASRDHRLLVTTYIIDDENDLADVDGYVHALVSMAVAHHEIHEGDTFFVSYKSPDASPIADDGTIIFAIVTGARMCHAISQGACGGDMEVELLEGSTITGGTATVAYNRNRLSANTATANALRDPTVNVDGTRIDNQLVPGGTGGLSIGGEGGQRNEWILHPNTTYVYRITNRAGNVQPMSLLVEWYEV